MLSRVEDYEVEYNSENKSNLFQYLIELNNQKKGLENQIEKVRSQLIKLHQKDGEVKIECDGHRSILRALPFSLSYLEKEYGIKAKELPENCFEIKQSFILNQENLERYLKYKGIELDNKYTVSFSCIREKIDIKKLSESMSEV